MIKSKEVEITGADGQPYTLLVEQLFATESALLLKRLVGLLGPALGTMLKGAELSDLASMDASGIGFGVGQLFEALTDADFNHICTVLFSRVQIVQSDKRVPLPWKKVDAVIGGDLSTLFRIIGVALEVNYRPFSGEVLGHVRGLLGTLASRSKTSSTSTGESGDSSKSVEQP